VSSEKSRAEIERTLRRYGAERFGYAQEDTRAAIVFEVAHRRVRFILPLPSKNEPAFTKSSRYPYTRTPEQRGKLWEQATRQRWRALALAIKAKLELVESKIVTFEEEFLSHIVLPDGQTVGTHVRPRVAEMYATTRMLPLLPGVSQEGGSA